MTTLHGLLGDWAFYSWSFDCLDRMVIFCQMMMFQICISWVHKRLDLHKVLGKILTNILFFHGDDLPLDRIRQKITEYTKLKKNKHCSPVPPNDV